MDVKYTKNSIILSGVKVTPVGLLLKYDKNGTQRNIVLLVDNIMPHYIKIKERAGDGYKTVLMLKLREEINRIWRGKSSVRYWDILNKMFREYKDIKRFQWFFYFAYYFIRESKESDGFIESIMSTNHMYRVWWIQKAMEDGRKEIEMINKKYVYSKVRVDMFNKEFITIPEKFVEESYEATVVIKKIGASSFYYKFIFTTKDEKYKIVISFVGAYAMRKKIIDKLYSGLYISSYKIAMGKVYKRGSVFIHLLWDLDVLKGLLSKDGRKMIKRLLKDVGSRNELSLYDNYNYRGSANRAYFAPLLYVYGKVVSKKKKIIEEYGEKYYEELLESLYKIQIEMFGSLIPGFHFKDVINIKGTKRVLVAALPILFGYSSLPFVGRASTIQGIVLNIADGYGYSAKKKLQEYKLVSGRVLKVSNYVIRYILSGSVVEGRTSKYLIMVENKVRLDLIYKSNKKVGVEVIGPLLLLELVELLWKYWVMVMMYPKDIDKESRYESVKRVLDFVIHKIYLKIGRHRVFGYNEKVEEVTKSVVELLRGREKRIFVYYGYIPNLYERIKECERSKTSCRDWWKNYGVNGNFMLIENVLFVGKKSDFVRVRKELIKRFVRFEKNRDVIKGFDIVVAIKGRNVRSTFMERLLLYTVAKSMSRGFKWRFNILYGKRLVEILRFVNDEKFWEDYDGCII